MYTHKVHYYETDRMGITHHSNYVRWMEEARMNYLSELGYPYNKLEEIGIISPIVSVSCSYKKTTTYPDIISIDVKVAEFKGLKLKLSYVMKNEQGDIVFKGETESCFLDKDGNIIMIKKAFPEFYKVINDEIDPIPFR